MQCLHAIAEYEELPLDELVAAVPERLDDAKDIGAMLGHRYTSIYIETVAIQSMGAY